MPDGFVEIRPPESVILRVGRPGSPGERLPGSAPPENPIARFFMTLQIGVVMDPIESINVKKDTTLAMLLAAQQKGWIVQYMTQPDLYSHGGVSRAKVRGLTVKDNPKDWFQFGAEQDIELRELDVILMRRDPPFDLDYI